MGPPRSNKRRQIIGYLTSSLRLTRQSSLVRILEEWDHSVLDVRGGVRAGKTMLFAAICSAVPPPINASRLHSMFCAERSPSVMCSLTFVV